MDQNKHAPMQRVTISCVIKPNRSSSPSEFVAIRVFRPPYYTDLSSLSSLFSLLFRVHGYQVVAHCRHAVSVTDAVVQTHCSRPYSPFLIVSMLSSDAVHPSASLVRMTSTRAARWHSATLLCGGYIYDSISIRIFDFYSNAV